MTVLEKIKRCVSLVWDFQEIYGEEDIEDFCRNELHTYPQHNEIMEYFKHIEELEKENAELNNFIIQSKKDGISPINALIIKNLGNQLIKAKELLAKWVELFKPKGGNIPPTPIQVETEQFIKDSEVEQ